MNISRLQRGIRQFKTTIVGVFSDFQKLEMKTIKWHMFDDGADDIVRNGGLFLYDACLDEYLHTFFKQSYDTTYNTRQRVMNDSIVVLGRRIGKNERMNTWSEQSTKMLDKEQ